MIILSQDKERIINFDNITQIGICELENWELRAETDGDSMCLGCYQTEERAKEVLEDILKEYNNIERGKIMSIALNVSYIPDNIYIEIPEE